MNPASVDDIALAVGSLALVAALADAAACDLKAFRIPNRAPLVAMAGFVPAAWAAAFTAGDLALHLGAAALMFAVGVGLFALRVWGGGDAKLVPAVVLWTGFAGLPRFLLVMALAGGVLALAVLAARRLAKTSAGWPGRFAGSGHVPYGVAIAAGGIDWWCATILPRLAG